MYKGQRKEGLTRRARIREKELNEHKAEQMLMDFEWEFYKDLFLSDDCLTDYYSEYDKKWKQLVELYNNRKNKKNKLLNYLAFFNTNINQKVSKDDRPISFGNPQLNYVCWIV